jgi:MoaA/NifB/PqqE/SkfB family radical SAM enzyme
MSRNKLWRPAVEFNVAEHCNLRCTHCDQASWMLPTKFADLDSFARDIEALSAVLQVRELKFGGGEPLAHPQLLDFFRVAKNIQFADRLVLLTNGTLLHRAPDELWELVDGMWISVYPGIKHRFDWDWVQRKADEHHIWVWRKETPEFAERLLAEEVRNEEFVRMVFQNCGLAHLESCHTIHDGRYYMCSPSVWTQPRLAIRGITFENRKSDGVAIHDNPNLYEELDSLVRRREPLEACRYCLGSWARSTPNVQLTRKGAAEFLARQPDNVDDLVDPQIIVPRPITQQPRPA